ncbi:hypothetical protein [Formosa sp. PL04]|uniref:hypothetical protein n=1 Tax=Formosa sp. PL04 TaxID=3081755 RepID=UPI00298286ED|nr:hypothetical protein [Formosa sp. PL04]MDW5289048.1 hypothetical protein [Formosa sp. PL04]
MKQFLLLFVAVLTLTSCINDDDYSNYVYEFLPTVSADVPEQVVLGETYRITIDYIKPTSCYIFDDIYYVATNEDIDDVDGEPISTEIRTVAVINVVNEDIDCTDLSDEEGQATAQFNFAPQKVGPYLFKFWIGEDEDGEDLFIEYETLVVE